MGKGSLKKIGTTNVNEVASLSVENKPWEEVVLSKSPMSLVKEPNGFLCTLGSACASMATTSSQGYKYISDCLVFRQDGDHINTDRYIGLVSLNNTLDVLKVPPVHNPHHRLSSSDPVIERLPALQREQIVKTLKQETE